MSLVVIEAAEHQRPVLRRLVELYRYDFSELDGADVDPHGEYGYRYLDHYWTDPTRHPFVFQVGGHWAGFALVHEGSPHDMAEFFVMRKYRRQGLGRQAAVELFGRFPGRWQVRQLLVNEAATAFWKEVIPYPFAQGLTPDEVVQEFAAGPQT
jgi:predicted acetyltransferase